MFSTIRRFYRQLPHKQWPLFSAVLLLLANMAFGFFLHTEYNSALYPWMAATLYVVLECSALSIAWKPMRNFVLLGFQSDVGYTCMALGIASFAVVALAWVQISTYFLMMLSAAILLRIKLYTERGGPLLSFLILTMLSIGGLALSWLPVLARFANFSFAQ